MVKQGFQARILPEGFATWKPKTSVAFKENLNPGIAVTVRSLALGPDDRSVTLVLGKYDARKPLTLTATGLLGADGTPTSEIITNL